jgi:cytochrome P450
MPFDYSAAGLTWGEGLLATSGQQHRRQRKMLNPVFSEARMRDMGRHCLSTIDWALFTHTLLSTHIL